MSEYSVDDINDITRVVRLADDAFRASGGTSRHWVIECLLPALEDEGLRIVRSELVDQLPTIPVKEKP